MEKRSQNQPDDDFALYTNVQRKYKTSATSMSQSRTFATAPQRPLHTWKWELKQ